MVSPLQIEISKQPDDRTCGPTCLHAIYRYYDDAISLEKVIAQVRSFKEGGTQAVFLACHALQRGYKARVYTYNLQLFDPTWLSGQGVDLAERLRLQLQHKPDARIAMATEGYLEFLALGGELQFRDMSPNLIKRYLHRGVPILTGLSATYLYKCPREYGSTDDYDDIRGEPVGHFVVLCEYQRKRKRILVADPYRANPLSADHYYHVGVGRLIHSILLGIVTYDANLLIIEPQ